MLLLLVLQFTVPLAALVLPDKPNRLGWQMYSGLGVANVLVTDQHEMPLDVPWGEVLAKSRRPELDWTQHLPEHLCTHLDEPELTVTVGQRSRTVTC